MSCGRRVVGNFRKAVTGLALLLCWTATAQRASAQLPDPNQGPGGPILVITSSSTPFGKYYAEILRTEGLNLFAVSDIAPVTQTTLASYDVVILAGPMTLTAGHVTMFTNWVNAGGNLIAMRPDPQLDSLLGITSTAGTLSDSYMLVDTSTAAGSGIVSQPMQFHGVARAYTLSGASRVATLYSNPTTATASPAVTVRNVGTSGGHAAAFAYDLATSIVRTRQGNPNWAAQERDGFTPIRSNDKFYGDATGDPQPDYVDLNTLVSIPQADEQQRLLANLILQMNLAKRPLPRFWYFPRGKKAVVVMTGDDHGNGGTVGRFEQQIAASPAGCSVANWECIRSTSYMFIQPQNVSNAQAASYKAQGFEVGLHVNTNCDNYTPTSLDTIYSQQTSDFKAAYPSVPELMTQRHHCIAWSDWGSGAKTQLKYGMRLDTSYYFWPPGWAQNRPGHFTGSAMPMRFADLDGTLINVYNAPTQMTDESGQAYPMTSDALLSAAVGPQGYYGVYTVNSHTDTATNPVSDAVVPSALARGVPVVSSAQMLTWLDSRNSSSFGGLAWNGSALSFSITPGSGANGLQAMVPTHSTSGVLTSITGPSGPVALTRDIIKGVEYAFFSATVGTYTATYAADTTRPTVTTMSPANGTTGVSQSTTVAATFSEAMDPSTITTSTVALRDPANAVVPATITYSANTAVLAPTSPLAAATTYTATITTGVKDLSGNTMAANQTWSFTTVAPPSCPCTIWNTSTTPANPAVNDPNAVELGVKFRVDLNGFITGIRFYKGTTNTGTHVGTLWSSAGQSLGTATFINETASGWQQVNFSTPVAVTASTVYVASYHTNVGNYAANSNFFGSSGVDNPPVHLLQNGVSGGNGVYAYNASSAFPSNTFQSTNYWVDVVFTISTGGDTTPPVISAVSATPGATSATIIWTTNEASSSGVNYGTSSGSLTSPATGPSNVTSHSVSLTGLAQGTTYFYRVTSVDAANNSATSPASPATLSFTTTTATTVTSTVFGNSAPITADEPDTASVELGMKFRSDIAGTVTGVRFYKSVNNVGVHTGSLWSSTGTMLGTVTFANETASGWQQASFGSPVAITAGTTYVVSYHAPNGHYAADSGYFTTTGVYNSPLYALRTGVNGANGVYRYGSTSVFPNQTFSASNYWVDVVLGTQATNAVRLLPAATVIQSGTLIGGTATALGADDNTFYQVRATTAGTRTAAWYGSFSGVPNTLTSLAVSYVGKNSTTCTEALSVWNFTTNAYVQINSSSVGTGEVLRSNVVPSGVIADYVSGTSGAGEVRVRVSCSTASTNFTSSGDLMSILYTP